MPLPLTVGDMLFNNARYNPTHAAFVQDGRQLTHGELAARSLQLGSAIHCRGLQRQDRVAILAMNCLEFMEVYGACELSGYILATVNYRLAPPEFEYILNDSTPRVLFFEEQYADVVAALRPQLKSIETYVCIGRKLDWAEDFENFRASGDAAGPPIRSIPDDIAYLIYTSGTTGRPKGCMLTQRGMVALAQQMANEGGLNGAERTLLAMPFFHIGSKSQSLGTHWRGGTVYVHRAFDAEATLKSIQADRITFVMLAPTLIQAMIDRPDIATYDLSSLRLVTYSAAPMPTPVVRRAIQVFGPILVQMYGQTEGSCSALFAHQHRPDGTAQEQGWLASAGQPFRDVQIRLIDGEGKECPVGTPGEITYRGAVMFSGYWNKSAASIEALRDGWVHSGDIGRFDEEGFLYIVDRLKDMIISGGENIYSREVEEALLSHVAVSEAAVIGVEDPKWGEAVRAVVVLKPGQQVTAEALIEHCRSRIASYKRPRSVLFAAELPKLPSGKISKIELRKTHGAPLA